MWIIQYPLIQGSGGERFDSILHLFLHCLLHRFLDPDEPLLHVSCTSATDFISFNLLDSSVVILNLNRRFKQEELLILRDHPEHLVLIDSFDSHFAILNALLASHERFLMTVILLIAQYRIFFFRYILIFDSSLTSIETTWIILLKFYLVSWLYVQILSTNEQSVDVHTKILTCVCQCQEFEELRVIQEEESAEDEALLLQVLVYFLLQDLVVESHFFEDLDSGLDHQIVNGFWILVT